MSNPPSGVELFEIPEPGKPISEPKRENPLEVRFRSRRGRSLRNQIEPGVRKPTMAEEKKAVEAVKPKPPTEEKIDIEWLEYRERMARAGCATPEKRPKDWKPLW